MNNNLAVPNEGSWPIAPYTAPPPPPPGQRSYSATSILDLATLLKIVHHWRWVVLGAIVAGFLAAVLITLLTPPVYRAWVTLEANPPSFSVSSDQSRERDAGTSNTYDFVATQVGLVSSKSVAERTAQELNLANNPAVVAQNADASQRLRAATAVVSGGLHVVPPTEGQLIKFSYDATSPQLAPPSPTASQTALSMPLCSGATKRPHMRATSSNGRSRRRVATSSGRSVRSSGTLRLRGSSIPRPATVSSPAVTPARCRESPWSR